jgi:hypothetical protein
MQAMAPMGFAIGLICATSAFMLSLAVCLRMSDPGWRRVIFSVGVAVAVLYIGIQPRGYDRWDAFAAIFYGGGALLGWFAGFGVATVRKRGST